MAFPKRLICSTLALSSLFGCSAQSQVTQAEKEEIEPISILCPAGAPALASLGAYDENVVFEYTQGQDLLVSELSKADSEFDAIIAPINVGIKAASQNEEWLTEAVLTWGNLYILSTEDQEWNTTGKTISAFGQGAVPGLVFNRLYDPLMAAADWLPSVAEASAAILAGQSQSALLAEPQLYMTQKKFGDEGVETYILADLQEVWQTQFHTGHEGYPQAALFAKRGVDVSGLLASMESFAANPDRGRIRELIGDIGADTLGAGSAEIALETWDLQHIDVQPAADVVDDIRLFLDVFGMELPENLIAQ